MGKEIRNVSGMTFGRLTAIERTGKDKHNHSLWLCRCDCGCETITLLGHLLTGNTNSCGCLHTEGLTIRNTTHGETKTRLFTIWQDIKRRTSNPNRKDYLRYGGRGIKVCEEWKNDFAVFRDWAMANGYQDNLSIDRIDNDGNYEPSNCRWADDKTQRNNKRNNHYLTVNEMTRTIAEWSETVGISTSKIRGRIKLGWPVERALELV